MIRPFFDDGQIVIYNGDCREILPVLPAGSADLALTDPPYNVGCQYDTYVDSNEGYADLISSTFAEMRRIAGVVMLTTGMRNLWLYPPADWVACWAKPGSVRASGLGGFSEWEPVLVYGKVKIYNDFFYLPDAVNHGDKLAARHPCPKPLGLYLRLVQQVPGVSVLDPFMGSGTTLLAAKMLGWKAVGIEVSAAYCQVAVDRLRQAVLLPHQALGAETIPMPLWGQ